MGYCHYCWGKNPTEAMTPVIAKKKTPPPRHSWLAVTMVGKKKPTAGGTYRNIWFGRGGK
jgi:hypothetical protein